MRETLITKSVQQYLATDTQFFERVTTTGCETQIKEVTLRGSHADIGFQHGNTLAAAVHTTLDFYRGLFAAFGCTTNQLNRYGARYKKVIAEFNPGYAEEIAALAEGAKVLNPHHLFALNARTEILNSLGGLNECTALSLPHAGLLAQNWDWSDRLAHLQVLQKVRPERGPHFVTLTEPGIIGKIGFNSEGVGVTLNVLCGSDKPRGVPIHILMRSVLDSPSFKAAQAKLSEAKTKTASSLIVADAEQNSKMFEFHDKGFNTIDPTDGINVHTNHYLVNPPTQRDAVPNSVDRYELSRAMLEHRNGHAQGLELVDKILSNRLHGDFSICTPYWDDGAFGRVGTLSTIIMDLKRRHMYISQQPPGALSCSGNGLQLSYRRIGLRKTL